MRATVCPVDMAFVLSSDRAKYDGRPTDCFSVYRDYLKERRAKFPPSAYQLAISDWYFSLADPRSPHDSWLQEASMIEDAADESGGRRQISLRIGLLNSTRDRRLEFVYSSVSQYTMNLTNGQWGHRDWRYDEFRLSDDGQVIHEIEWWGPREVGRWVIVSSDVILRSLPFTRGGTA